MTPPMIGNWRARIVGVRPFAIHGDNYFELHISRLEVPAGESADLLLRAPSHAFPTPPDAGQQVEITFLMGQVTTVRLVGE